MTDSARRRGLHTLGETQRRRIVACVAAVLVLVVGAGACSEDAPEDPSAFCDALRRSATNSGAVEQLDLDDPASLEAAQLELEALVELAPEDLRDDVAVVAEVYATIIDAVSTTAPAARGDVLRDLQPRLDEAAEPAQRLQRFGEQTCRLAFDGPQQPTPTPTPLQIDD